MYIFWAGLKYIQQFYYDGKHYIKTQNKNITISIQHSIFLKKKQDQSR